MELCPPTTDVSLLANGSPPVAPTAVQSVATPIRHAVPDGDAHQAEIAAVEAYWDQVADTAIVLFADDGQVLHVNAGAERLYGLSAARLRSMRWEQFRIAGGFPADADLPTAHGDATRSFEACPTGPDGERRLDVSVSPLVIDAGRRRGYAVSAVDVTDRHRSEETLRQMVEHSLNAIVLVDRRGVIVSVNVQTERMFGYPRHRLIGRPVEILVPERFLADHARNRESFFARPVVRPMGAGRDLFGRRADGFEFPVEIGLSPVQTADGPAVLASIVDITERKRAERRFRLAVESAPDAIVMINGEGRIVLINLQTEKLFGYSRDELLGQLVEILVPERNRARHSGYRDSFLAQPRARSMGAGRELFGRRKDGSEFPIEIGLNPIETGDETLVLSAILDITARKEAELKVRKHLADLAHVARLSTLGEMFSELAHEINQPLAAAANYARACVTFAKAGEGATREQLIEWMEKSAAQAGRAIDIVKRLGSFVKKDGGVRTSVDVNELVEQVVGHSVPAMQAAADGAPPIELVLELDPAMPPISADRVQIEQVLLNLVRNAVEAMQERRSRPSRLTVQSTFGPASVTVAIADTGPGVPPENLPRLFDPYYTTKASGIGLGLSISRSIAQDHGGDLSAESSPAGTVFRVTLPIAHPGNLL